MKLLTIRKNMLVRSERRKTTLIQFQQGRKIGVNFKI